tara:strand:- start:896 stop:2578 length:1683 start_codon:yes stop_codon:yes gene_type:complete
MIFSSLAESVSLASVLPFLTVLVNPEALWENSFINYWSKTFGLTSANELMLPITLAFALAAVLAGIIRIINLWLSTHLGAAIGSDLSCEIYKRNLYQPYSIHLQRNSSNMIASATAEVNKLIGGFLNPCLSLISSSFLAISLVFTLLAINPRIAIGSGLTISLIYGIVVLLTNKRLKRIGKRAVKLNRDLIQTLQEGLGAIRDVLLDGSQEFYLSIHRKIDKPLRKTQATSAYLSAYPKFVLEPIGIAVIATIAYQLVIDGGIVKALPTLGTLALGAQRLLPIAQKIYEAISATQGSKASLNNILFNLNQELPDIKSITNTKPLYLRETIKFENVGFKYNKYQVEIIKDLNINIRKGERVGIIGKTGSGKSTTVDLLMGLLYPTSGKVLIDGIDMHDERYKKMIANWKASIAHVPQNIYLSDGCIYENIAFGTPKESIDKDLVKLAAKQAQISHYIENTNSGYESYVGERGIRLSGGQRQRIGIARALYKKAQVLVFDEATSALDTETENAVMNAIDNLNRELTIIMIAHRLTTVSRCDRIIKLENGKVVFEGAPKELNI